MSIPVYAAPGLRVQVIQHGDFVLFGNTFGQECAAGTPAPVVGTLGSCGASTADQAPDVFWRADSPAAGQVEANDGITVDQARSTALLSLPAGAQVTHAYLYWSATLSPAGSDTTAALDRPGAGGFTSSVIALQSFADVTTLVQIHGAGAYRVSDVHMNNIVDQNDGEHYGGWWMVVLYQRDTDPLRNLIVHDGLDVVTGSGSQDVTLSGLNVPAGAIDARLGIAAVEGDNGATTDSIAFDGSTLSDAQNPADNFFNSTRSYLGAAVPVAGDLPQLTGAPQSMSGLDLDVVNVAPYLTAGQTSASISASGFGDVYFLTTLVASIPTAAPDIHTLAPTAGANGSISPSTTQTIGHGGLQTFTITADTGYQVADVLIDGVSVGAVTSYTFTNVAANHTIRASFAAVAPPEYRIYLPFVTKP